MYYVHNFRFSLCFYYLNFYFKLWQNTQIMKYVNIQYGDLSLGYIRLNLSLDICIKPLKQKLKTLRSITGSCSTIPSKGNCKVDYFQIYRAV